LTRRICAYRSSLGEPVRRPLRRSAGHAPARRVPGGRRPHPGGGGQRRSTARWDCRSRVVPVRRRADRRVARAGRAGGERSGWRRLGWNPAQRVRFPASPHCALPAWGIPRVGSRGKGDEGANAHGNARASLPGTLPLCGARASGAHAGGTPAHPAQTSGQRARLRCARGRGRPRTRRKPQVRAPPVRTRAGRAARQELDAEFRTSGAHAGRTPALPAQTSGARALAGSGLLASPGVPSFLSGIRTPKLPLLPQGEQGARGMRGQTHTGMQNITHRSQELYP
jgi:hypothetical protein